MTATQLLSELGRLGVRLQVRRDRLQYYPRSMVTPDLFDRLKAHKRELLEIVERQEVEFTIDVATDPIDAMYRRINQAMPQGVHLPEEFWCRLDPLQVELHAAWSAADAERVAKAVDRYEATVVKFFRNTLLAQNASDG
jgi:hypothetical protein